MIDRSDLIPIFSVHFIDNEIHIAFIADDYDAAHAFHKDMGCICYENEKMGIYFIEDPDGYTVEIFECLLPAYE